MKAGESKAIRRVLAGPRLDFRPQLGITAASLTRQQRGEIGNSEALPPLVQLFRRSGKRHMSAETEEYLTVDQLAARLGWSPKTVRNKMAPGGIFKKGVHYSEAPGLPVIFKWSAVLKLYNWTQTPETMTDDGIRNVETSIPMARGYLMK